MNATRIIGAMYPRIAKAAPTAGVDPLGLRSLCELRLQRRDLRGNVCASQPQMTIQH